MYHDKGSFITLAIIPLLGVKQLIVIGGPASNNLEQKIAKLLQVPSLKVYHKVFPDNESYIRLDKADIVSNQDVIIVQSLYPPQDKHFVELLLLVDLVRDYNAKSVTTVVPYLAYSRQDKRFLEGEPISVKTILNSLSTIGVDYFITVDIHNRDSLKYFKGKGAFDVTAIPVIADYVKENIDLNDLLVLAPDKGALWRAKELASLLGLEYDYLEKFRDRYTGEVRVKPKSLDVKGKKVLIIDDIISTGGTIALATRESLRQGAREVYVACTHALLVGSAIKKLKNAGITRLIATDTMPSPYSSVSVAPVIAKKLKEVI